MESMTTQNTACALMGIFDMKRVDPSTMKPLFVPLCRKWFEQFKDGTKARHNDIMEEYRQYGPRWNEKTCYVGRPVVLSLGYGKQQRLKGVISSFRVVACPADSIPAWFEVYGWRFDDVAACIGITLEDQA